MAFDQFEEYVSFDQLDILEDLFSGRYEFHVTIDELASLENEYFNTDSDLTAERANEIIYYLRENKIEGDLDKIFNSKYL